MAGWKASCRRSATRHRRGHLNTVRAIISPQLDAVDARLPAGRVRGLQQGVFFLPLILKTFGFHRGDRGRVLDRRAECDGRARHALFLAPLGQHRRTRLAPGDASLVIGGGRARSSPAARSGSKRAADARRVRVRRLRHLGLAAGSSGTLPTAFLGAAAAAAGDRVHQLGRQYFGVHGAAIRRPLA